MDIYMCFKNGERLGVHRIQSDQLADVEDSSAI